MDTIQELRENGASMDLVMLAIWEKRFRDLRLRNLEDRRRTKRTKR